MNHVKNVSDPKKQTISIEIRLREIESDHAASLQDASREREDFNLKMQELKEGFESVLQKVKEQHAVDVQALNQEKDALRARMIASIDELFEKHRKQQEELLENHREMVEQLKSQIAQQEADYSAKMLQSKEDVRKIHEDYNSRTSTLSGELDNLTKQLSDRENELDELKQRVDEAERSKEEALQVARNQERELKKEIDDLKNQLLKETGEFKDRIQDLEYENDSALKRAGELEQKMTELDLQKNKIAAELDDRNAFYESEKTSRSRLEERLSTLQSQLTEERSRCDVTSKSFDDCRSRMKQLQSEHLDFKKRAEDLQLKLSDSESALTKSESFVSNLKSTLRDVEQDRQNLKREISKLKRHVSSLEKELASRREEAEEANSLRLREEEAHEAAKKELIQIKQKLLETGAARDAFHIELTTSKSRCSELDQKLRMQQEQQQSLLHECLEGERSMSELRLKREKQASEAAKELQELRARLHREEGRVLALETKLVNLDGSKRTLETKLYSLHSFLRSILGLGPDSGFLTHSFQNSISSSNFTQLESTRNSAVHIMGLAEMDLEQLKGAVGEMMQKANGAVRERDELKASLTKLQKETDEIKEEHSRCISKSFSMKKEIEDKKLLMEELEKRTSYARQCEDTIRKLEGSNKSISEKIKSIDETAFKKTETLQERISDLLQSERRLQEESSSLRIASESANSRYSKCLQAYESLEKDASHMRKLLAEKEREVQKLENEIESLNRRLKSTESKSKSSIDLLSSRVETSAESEKLLKQKIVDLTASLSSTALSQQSLYKDIERKQKENIKYQSDLYKAQQLADKLKSCAEEHKLRCRVLQEETEELKRKLAQSESAQDEHTQKIAQLQKLLQSTQSNARDFEDQITRLQAELKASQKKSASLTASLTLVTGEKDELVSRMEKETVSLKKSLTKLEKERAKSSDLTAKSLAERSVLGKSLSQMEIENQSLQRKVQDLQAQLAELEERHSQRLGDFYRSQESQREESRLRSSLRKAEQRLEALEQSAREDAAAYEEQLSMLKSHLQQEKKRWQQFHQQSLNISELHQILSQSLDCVTSSDPAHRLLPQAQLLDRTTEGVLTDTPHFKIATPSRLRSARLGSQRTSTPKAKKQLDLASGSKS